MLIRRIYSIIVMFGFYPLTFLKVIRNAPVFIRDLIKYKKLSKGKEFPFKLKNIYPILIDYQDNAGSARGHYFFQDIWAAKKIYKVNPKTHIDIGSRIDGFVAHLLSFREVEVVDIRPLESNIEGLNFKQADATKLECYEDDSIESLSSLHAAEHFGLGRYGDPVDPDAYILFILALKRVLKQGGTLYFSVPCGKERVEFNAHRVFAPSTVLRHFDGLKLVSFSCVKDDGQFYENVNVDDIAEANLGCGFFEFTK